MVSPLWLKPWLCRSGAVAEGCYAVVQPVHWGTTLSSITFAYRPSMAVRCFFGIFLSYRGADWSLKSKLVWKMLATHLSVLHPLKMKFHIRVFSHIATTSSTSSFHRPAITVPPSPSPPGTNCPTVALHILSSQKSTVSTFLINI